MINILVDWILRILLSIFLDLSAKPKIHLSNFTLFEFKIEQQI
jgi:hypothetical protein